MRISDWSSDVCSSDLGQSDPQRTPAARERELQVPRQRNGNGKPRDGETERDPRQIQKHGALPDELNRETCQTRKPDSGKGGAYRKNAVQTPVKGRGTSDEQNRKTPWRAKDREQG